MRVVEVTREQQRVSQIKIEILEKLDRPIPDWTRKIATARRRPEEVDAALEASDEVVVYLV
ncbi:MAG TPA: hypothetical protein PLZ93_05975 [Nocardioides sp.]|uniref:hypothetical protein n=1 Tax=uncultured Nocardioides sp. TaxID=198441 RepID=UPI000ED69BFC|nr:hypothetical protein [uncultured Nocardioides sp.]HCB06126.1 hypothetical protein [Nocardioides sp.]HRD61505.1 hypothetical protein [Nocardioides sp.]HRI95138.1 hypothetical protein [Nocardioides sp.]HRK45246.1 hypothetical protein [Nocardioides sp.]